MLQKRIAGIEFSILGPEMIRKMSGIEIKNPDTYDKDGFPMENGLMDPHLGVINPGLRCKTCGQMMKTCPGHFGHINLVRPVVHSEFGKKIEELMHGTCQDCGKVALPNEKIEEMRALLSDETVDVVKRVLAKTKKVKKCPHCGFERQIVLLDKPTNFYIDRDRIYPTQIREWMEKISDKDLELFGYQAGRVRPEWFVITALQVPPINIRPSITLESGIKSEDDLTHKLVDIIRINLRLKDNIDAGAPQLIIEDLWDLLQYHVTTYFDNNTAGVPPAKHRSGRALRTLVQRLKGKKGRFRYNLTGKRVNFAARSTITPDPYLGINELGVPKPIANDLTVPEYVTEWNEKRIKKLLKDTDVVQYIVRPNGQRRRVTPDFKAEILEELTIGYKVERFLQDGDVVIFNRQPSLHRMSMMAHLVRVMDGKTFRLNPTVCAPYNADFDGDEMNMHVPQTEEGKAEALQLMLVQKQIISPRHGSPVIALTEDFISGCFVLTLPTTTFSRTEAMEFFYEMGLDELPKADLPNETYSGKLIFSQLLPKDLNMSYPSMISGFARKAGFVEKDKPVTIESCGIDGDVVIENGRIKSGVIDSTSVGSGGKLIDVLTREYPPEVIEKFFRLICRLSSILLTRKGMTSGLDEYQTSEPVQQLVKQVITDELSETGELVKAFQNGTLEVIPGKNLQESFETKILVAGLKHKGKVENLILQEKMNSVFKSDFVPYNSTIQILAKAKGTTLNLTNMSGVYGQVTVRDGRPRKGFTKRLSSTSARGDLGAIAGGFVEQNFIKGLAPREMFMHSMGGRQGEVDTSVATKVSGYLYRRLANALKDLVVQNDETVRTSNNNLIQYVYGEDAVFPQNAVKGKGIQVKVELDKLRRAHAKS